MLCFFMQRILRAKEVSNFKITSNSYRSRERQAGDRNRSIRICRCKFCRRPRNVKSLARISRGVHHYPRQFYLKDAEHQGSEGVLSLHSLSCGSPRAQTRGAHSPLRFQAAPKPNLTSIGFSQRTWRTITATAKNTEVVVNSRTSPSTSRVCCDSEVVMKLTEQHDDHPLQHS